MKTTVTINDGGRKVAMLDLTAAMRAAFKIQWEQKCKRAADYPRAGRYVVASDIEGQVRVLARDTLDGNPWGTSKPSWGRSYYAPVRVTLSRPGETLLGACRSWLFSEVRAGRLAAHNFGRGHISGERFRPIGEEMTDAEKRTTAAREARRNGTAKPKPVHYSPNWSSPECTRARRHGFSRPNRYTRTTRDAEKVTCPRCLKMLADGTARPAPKVEV